MKNKMFPSSNGLDSIDLHGIRHKEALEMVREKIDEVYIYGDTNPKLCPRAGTIAFNFWLIGRQ